VLHASPWDRILHDFARYVRTGRINPGMSDFIETEVSRDYAGHPVSGR
jgi:hypothetical protein